jgi:hypothetical protein
MDAKKRDLALFAALSLFCAGVRGICNVCRDGFLDQPVPRAELWDFCNARQIFFYSHIADRFSCSAVTKLQQTEAGE